MYTDELSLHQHSLVVNTLNQYLWTKRYSDLQRSNMFCRFPVPDLCDFVDDDGIEIAKKYNVVPGKIDKNIGISFNWT